MNYIKYTCLTFLLLSSHSLSHANMCPDVTAAKQAWMQSVDQWKTVQQAIHPDENLADAGLDSVEDFMGETMDEIPELPEDALLACQSDELVSLEPRTMAEALHQDLLDEVRAFLPDEQEVSIDAQLLEQRSALEQTMQQTMINFLQAKQACCEGIREAGRSNTLESAREVSATNLPGASESDAQAVTADDDN